MVHSNDAADKLRKVRTIATLLLVAAAVVFVVASLNVARYPWLAYVKAFAEAAMVGALADWFAVVAIGGAVVLVAAAMAEAVVVVSVVVEAVSVAVALRGIGK